MLDSLLVKLPRETEVTPEMAQNFLAALSQVTKRPGFLKSLFGASAPPLALELVSTQQQIKFVVTCDSALTEFISTQIKSNYPLVVVDKIKDPLLGSPPLHIAKLMINKANYYPIKTFPNFTEVDPLSSIIAVLSKATPDEVAIVQLALASADNSWQKQGQIAMDKGRPGDEPEQTKALPEQQSIKEKISLPGFYFTLRIAATNKTRLTELSSAFGVYTRADGNGFSFKASGGNWRLELQSETKS